MRYARLTLSLGALLFGIGVLGISFANANSILSANNVNESTRQFYVNQNILPDHVAYPVLMAVDKVRLELEPPTEQIYTQVEYGNRRLEYAQTLIERGNQAVALSTLTKAEKYILHAAQEALAQDAAPTVKHFLIRTLSYHQERMQQLKPSFVDSDRVQLDQLIHQQQIVKEQLQSSLPS